MARRLFMHVGTPKSGTTFLQSVWWANQPALRAQGLLLPGAAIRDHYWASCVVRGGRQLDHIPDAGLRAWDQVLDEASRFDGDALVSHELFSPAPIDRVREARRRLESVADEVHIVLTARDLARQIPAEWQQRTKHGRSQSLDEFVDMIQQDASVNFWRVQDVPAILDRWGEGIPAERVHLVVLPPPGGHRLWVWDQVCEVTGIDGSGMSENATRSNESLGLVEVETMRRVSAVLEDGGLDKRTSRFLKDFFAEEILRSTQPEKILVPAPAHAWVMEQGQRMVEELRTRDYDIRGDLADLVPSLPAQPGRRSGDVAESEVAATAVRALARYVRHDVERRRSQPAGTGSVPSQGTGRARALVRKFRGRLGRR